jgi:GNAT superfamily N-acetyltransferase
VASYTVRVLGPDDADVLAHVAPEVFDREVDARWATSGVHYVHPDKPPELWVNEVGVAPTHQGQGIGRKLMEALLAQGRALGCQEAWVLTEYTNTAARRLYESVGGVDAPDPTLMVTFYLDDT